MNKDCDAFGQLEIVCPFPEPFTQDCFEECVRATVKNDGRSQHVADSVIERGREIEKGGKVEDRPVICEECEGKEQCWGPDLEEYK